MFNGVNGVLGGPYMETLLDQKHLQSSKVKKLWEKRFYKPVNEMWSCFFAWKKPEFQAQDFKNLESKKSTVPYTSHELLIFQLMRTCEYIWWVPILQRDNLRKWKLQWSCISWEYLKLTVFKIMLSMVQAHASSNALKFQQHQGEKC